MNERRVLPLMRDAARILWATVFLLGLIGATSAHAVEVSGSYEGVITSDSGIGLIGQTMRFDFTYDDAVAGTPSGAAYFYTSYLVSATVTIGTNVWVYNGGGSNAFLNNDDVIVFNIGTEDRVTLSSSDYTGPDLGLGATNSSARSFTVRLSDNVPAGAPDGLTDDAVLPNPAPDPALFQTSQFASRGLTFSWVVGDPETGDFYSIQTSDLEASSVPVPTPRALAPILVATLLLTARRALRPRDTEAARALA